MLYSNHRVKQLWVDHEVCDMWRWMVMQCVKLGNSYSL